jgi:tryptophan synthase alpha chain
MKSNNRIDATFDRLSKEQKKAFIAYIMAGDPSLNATKERVLLLEKCGVDIIELGVPFSDPVADGPTIQRAAERALSSGTTLRSVLECVAELRRTTQIPIVLMTYYNIVFVYGQDRFVHDALYAGVDGVIIPDLPPEEGAAFAAAAKAGSNGQRLAVIFLVAPTSSEERIKKIVSASSGFVYYVSMTGTTGGALHVDPMFTQHIARVRELSSPKPVAVGFGVSHAQDASTMREVADGVIVGSALVKVFHEHPDAAEAFIRQLREAI